MCVLLVQARRVPAPQVPKGQRAQLVLLVPPVPVDPKVGLAANTPKMPLDLSLCGTQKKTLQPQPLLQSLPHYTCSTGPQGDQGTTGTQGPQGTTGQRGPAGGECVSYTGWQLSYQKVSMLCHPNSKAARRS
jgi:hypothetical protein